MRNARSRSTSFHIQVLIAIGLALYVVGTLGYLIFGASFFVALAFIVVCAAAWLRAAAIARRRRLSRERRLRRTQRIAAHDQFWLEEDQAA